MTELAVRHRRERHTGWRAKGRESGDGNSGNIKADRRRRGGGVARGAEEDAMAIALLLYCSIGLLTGSSPLRL